MSAPPNVLFIGANHTGRSQMAAGWLRHLAGDSVDVHAAAAAPGKFSPAMLAAAAEAAIGFDTARPWQVDDHALLNSNVIITLGCGNARLLFPRKHYEDWNVEDPAGHDLDTVRALRDDIRARVEQLLTRLRADR